MPYDVFGIGNALVDLQVRVTDAELEELTLVKGGMGLTTLAEQARILDALQGRMDNLCSGGSAANTMHGVCAFGGHAYYLGRVASDDFGHHYARDMVEAGVGFPGTDAAPSGTGTSLILITPDAQRTMCTHLGISAQLHPDNVDPTIVADSKMVYIEGYLWDAPEPRAAAVRLAELAHDAGIPVAFTISDSFLVHRYRDSLLQFIGHHVDVLFCNDSEGRALAEEPQSAAAFRTVSRLVAKLFYTLSDKGAWVAHEGEEPQAILPFPVRAVDTTGAGDLFAAGALFGLTHGHTLAEAAVLGNYCGSRIVGRLGARLPERLEGKVPQIIESYHARP